MRHAECVEAVLCYGHARARHRALEPPELKSVLLMRIFAKSITDFI
jgi:hypothetical protein